MASRRSADPGGLTFTERARRQQIVECTIDLISSRGYPGTSLSAIAEEAGISKAAILYHFSSKDNLTRATLEHVLERFLAHVTERVERETDPAAAVVAYVRAMISYQHANRRHVRVITEMLLDDKGGTRLKTPGSHDTYDRWQGLSRLLAAGQEAGAFRAFDPRTTALAVGGAIDNVISYWLVHPEFDLDAAADELVTFTMNAIGHRD
ncbi:TetR/AcrR family transcriptional regulator [Streptomyces griseocarneus]|uniref:TetR/AcrR family transcriptional regulator n=1 Tax=Streptomyces griseocarneus TaxID=51201 RepID=UPI00167F0561|nr:TetR/AcrR family transcriptional regulator [Streptomyces griseocarneus]MBZ6472542.1 TetR/AcrR family transcriptional regulator [Streptomyces griseocarneus]GHG45794.1 putative transcriptional regulator, TetR family protein [Streptomyces griseocarneus]